MSAETHFRARKVRVDTLLVHDTITFEKPVIQKVAVIDTLRLSLPVTDTLMLHDTFFVHLPIEQHQYGDSRYTAWVSGNRAALDSIQIYQTTQYITKEVKVTSKPKR